MQTSAHAFAAGWIIRRRAGSNLCDIDSSRLLFSATREHKFRRLKNLRSTLSAAEHEVKRRRKQKEEKSPAFCFLLFIYSPSHSAAALYIFTSTPFTLYAVSGFLALTLPFEAAAGASWNDYMHALAPAAVCQHNCQQTRTTFGARRATLCCMRAAHFTVETQ